MRRKARSTLWRALNGTINPVPAKCDLAAARNERHIEKFILGTQIPYITVMEL